MTEKFKEMSRLTEDEAKFTLIQRVAGILLTDPEMEHFLDNFNERGPYNMLDSFMFTIETQNETTELLNGVIVTKEAIETFDRIVEKHRTEIQKITG